MLLLIYTVFSENFHNRPISQVLISLDSYQIQITAQKHQSGYKNNNNKKMNVVNCYKGPRHQYPCKGHLSGWTQLGMRPWGVYQGWSRGISRQILRSRVSENNFTSVDSKASPPFYLEESTRVSPRLTPMHLIQKVFKQLGD